MSNVEKIDHEPRAAAASRPVSNDSASSSSHTAVSPPDQEKPSDATFHEPPDGGLWPWLRVLAAFLLFVITWGPALTYGCFQYYYQTSLLSSYSETDIAWIGSVQAFLLVAVGVLAGPLFDRGYLKPIMVFGAFLAVLGMFMTSLCTKYYQFFLAQGICFGTGSGLVYVPGLSLVSVDFSTKRPLAMGLTTSGAAVGGIIFPIVFRQLQPRIGFPWTCRVMGFIQLVLGIIAMCLLYNAPVRKSKPRTLLDLGAFKEKPFALFAACLFLQFLAYWVPVFYIPTFAISKVHTSTDFAFNSLAITNAGSFFGRILPPLIARKKTPVDVLTFSTFASAIILFGWIGVVNVGGFVVFCLFWGFFSGAIITVDPVVMSHPALTPEMGELGTRMGMAWCFFSVGILIGAPISFQLANPATESFVKAQAFAGAIMFGAGLCLIWPRVAIKRTDRRLSACS